MKRILFSLAIIPIICFLWWCSGYDFDKRGEDLAFLYLACVFSIGFIYFFSK